MVGSVSAQYVYGTCNAIGNGNWNIPSNWNNCGVGTPTTTSDSASLGSFDIVITGNEQAQTLSVGSQSGSLFIDCSGSLTVAQGGSTFGIITNHGIFTVISGFYTIFGPGIFSNSGMFTNVNTAEGGAIQQITSICPVIGGTLVPVDTLSLIVAGTQANIQANIGWLSLAIVGIIAAGAGIALKKRSEKNNEN